MNFRLVNYKNEFVINNLIKIKLKVRLICDSTLVARFVK